MDSRTAPINDPRMENEAVHLWREVDRLLAFHQKRADKSPREALNRIFREHCRKGQLSPVPTLTEETCPIERLTWAPARLSDLITLHTITTPRNEDEPIVVGQFLSNLFVLDGNKRVNKLRQQNEANDFDVILLTVC